MKITLFRIATMVLLLFYIHDTKYRSTEPIFMLPQLTYKPIVLEEIECYQPEEVLATIAWHECTNLSWQERWLIMEATWNRVIHNFNNNGKSLSEQIKADKQFPRIFKNYSSNKSDYRQIFNPNNNIIAQNYLMAQRIIEGERLSKKTIFYWASQSDKGVHYEKCLKKRILTKFATKHIFA